MYKEKVKLKYIYFSVVFMGMYICTEFCFLDSIYRYHTLIKRAKIIKKLPMNIKKKLQKEFLEKIDCKFINSQNIFKCFNQVSELDWSTSCSRGEFCYCYRYLEFIHDFDEMFLWLLDSYYYNLDRYWIYNSKKISKSLFMCFE